MNRFLQGGPQDYGKALRQQHRGELDALRIQLKAATTEVQREEIQQQIVRLNEAYRAKSRSSGRSLF